MYNDNSHLLILLLLVTYCSFFKVFFLIIFYEAWKKMCTHFPYHHHDLSTPHKLQRNNLGFLDNLSRSFLYIKTTEKQNGYCMCDMQNLVILVTFSCQTVRCPVWLWGQFNKWDWTSVWNHLVVSVHWFTVVNARFVNIYNKYFTHYFCI